MTCYPPRMARSIRRSLVLMLVLRVGLCAVAADAALEAARDGSTIIGSVTDSETSEPLAGAVVLLPDAEGVAITGPEGRYSLSNIPAGPQHLLIRRIGYEARTLHALVPLRGELEIHVSLKSRPVRIDPLDVGAPSVPRVVELGDSTGPEGRESSIAAIRNHPLLTEPDVLQALSGGDVVLSAETPTGVHVKGAAADHLAYRVDGIPVFSPYHAAGMSSAWNPDALSRLRLTSSGASEGDPHALAGSLDAVSLPPGERLSVQGSVSSTQARATIDGPLGAAGARFLLSGRAGFAGLLTHKQESSHLRGETGDWLGKVEIPGFGGRFRVLGYDATNEIEASATSGSEPPPDPPIPNNTFDWRSRSWGAEWRAGHGALGWRALGWSARGNAEAGWNAEAGPVSLRAVRRDIGILASVEHRLPGWRLLAGVRAERARTSYRIESDSLAPGDLSAQARTPVATLFARVAGRMGVRGEWRIGSAISVSESRAYHSPRATLRLNPSGRFSLSGSLERSHQFAQSLRNAESIVGTIFPYDLYLGADGAGAAAGTSGIPVAFSDQAVVAAELLPAAGVRVTMQAHARDSDRLALVAPRSGEPFSLGAFVIGSGTARGVSVDATLRRTRYGLLASYGFQDVRLEYGDSSYVPEYGAKHLLAGGAVFFPTATLSVRLGAEAAWGRRTTTAIGPFEWEACNLLDQGCEFGGSPHYGGEPLGGAALPAYSRVDLGVRQHWHFTAGGRDVTMALFASVTNLLGRRNVLTYSKDSTGGPATAVEMRPRAPLVVGLDWKF